MWGGVKSPGSCPPRFVHLPPPPSLPGAALLLPLPPLQAEAARRSVSAHVAASKSDHLAVVAAYNSWRAVVEMGGGGGARGTGGATWCTRRWRRALAVRLV